MSNLTIFNFENTLVQTIVENNEIFFRAAQLAELLEYKNPHDALKKHVDPDDLAKREIVNIVNKRAQVLFVNESGMYSLILGSKLESAKKVKRWVTSEVLPQIRKTGKYEVTQPALPTPEPIYNQNFTQQDIHHFVWLLFSHEKMRFLLERLYKPLELLDSPMSAKVYGHVTEYRRIYKAAKPLIKKLLDNLKADNPEQWRQLTRYLNDEI